MQAHPFSFIRDSGRKGGCSVGQTQIELFGTDLQLPCLKSVAAGTTIRKKRPEFGTCCLCYHVFVIDLRTEIM